MSPFAVTVPVAVPVAGVLLPPTDRLARGMEASAALAVTSSL